VPFPETFGYTLLYETINSPVFLRGFGTRSLTLGNHMKKCSGKHCDIRKIECISENIPYTTKKWTGRGKEHIQKYGGEIS
jgi:hypothetical protein